MNTQGLFLLFTDADRSDDPLAFLDEAAYEACAEMDSPNSIEFERAREDLAEWWQIHYDAWVTLGKPPVVDLTPNTPVEDDPFACPDYSLGDPDRQFV
jgi:hypothetical protein